MHFAILLQGFKEPDLETLKIIHDNLEDVIESQVDNLSAQEARKRGFENVLIIVSHPWTRLVNLYKSKFEQFNFKYYINHGTLMNKTGPKRRIFDDFQWIQPTFSDFIDYILVHHGKQWSPVWQLCQVCSFPTNTNYYVFKTETIRHEGMYFWPTKVLNAHEYISDVSTKEYMTKLRPEKIKELIKMYQQDFDTFGYSADTM